MKVAVVEDSAADAATLISYIKHYGQERSLTFEIAHFENALDFVSDYRPVFDLIFLDVAMPYMNGMEAAVKIREVDADSSLIFVTNLSQYAIQGYEVQATDFLLKPLIYRRFCEKLSAAVRHVEYSRKKAPLFVCDEYGRNIRIFVSDVYYILKDKNYVHYYVGDNIFRRREEMKAAIPRLKSAPFVQVNSGCCVNLDYLEEMSLNTVTVKGVVFPIARTRKKRLQESVMRYFSGEREGIME